MFSDSNKNNGKGLFNKYIALFLFCESKMP